MSKTTIVIRVPDECDKEIEKCVDEINSKRMTESTYITKNQYISELVQVALKNKLTK